MELIDFDKSTFCQPANLKVLDDLISELDEEEKLLFEVKQTERKFIQNAIKIRKELGLTQSELARKTGLTQQVISNIEKCGRRPTLTNLIRYLRGLGLDINNIIRV